MIFGEMNISQLAPVVHPLIVFEQEADVRADRQHRDLWCVRTFFLRINAADYTVPPFSTSTSVVILLVSMEGPDVVTEPTLSLCTFTFMITLSSGADLRLDLERERCFSERYRSRAARGRLLV